MKKFRSLISLMMAITLMASLTITAFAAPVNNFTDVDESDWFAAGVKFCVDKGIMSGTSKTTFNPNNSMTRGMMAAVMYRAVGEPKLSDDVIDGSFVDVEQGKYYESAIYWAKKDGIMGGYDDTHFGPNDNITREQIVTILWRYLGSPKATAEDFEDEDTIGGYAQGAVDWARNTGVVAGKSGNNFDPKGLATRAQVAVIFQRFIEG